MEQSIFPFTFIALFHSIKKYFLDLILLRQVLPFSAIPLHVKLNQDLIYFAVVITLYTFGFPKQTQLSLSCIYT